MFNAGSRLNRFSPVQPDPFFLWTTRPKERAKPAGKKGLAARN